MIYLKRFLYIFTIIILYTLTFLVTLLYIVVLPISMIISFIVTEDFTKCFNLFVNFDGYLTFITDKLEYIFLKR